MTKSLVRLAIAALLILSPPIDAQVPERPVVIIPGILGSKICTRASGAVVWGDRWSLSNFATLALPVQYDRKTLPHVACGLIEAINVLGPFQVHQYDDLLATLQGMGYAAGRTLFVFSYDWRLSNRENAEQLDDFVKRQLPANAQFDIVAHSMGGIIAKLWMAERGGAARVSTLVTMGTPYQGAATTFKQLDAGFGFWGNLLAHGLSGIREAALTFPSLYELLPSYDRCCAFRGARPADTTFFDPFASAQWTKFRWMPATFQTPERQDWLRRTLTAAKAIAKVELPAGPTVVPIVNSLIPTAWRVEFDPADGHVLNYIPQPGDGTVYQNSAANNQLVNARPALSKHQTIFADDASRQVLRWVLTRGPEPTKGVLPTVRATLRAANGAHVDISGASAEIVPAVLAPEESAQFVVELSGSEDLTTADLSNIGVLQDGAPVSASPLRREVQSPAGGPTVLRLVFPVKAPKELGAFSVAVNLPGVAELPDVALVVPK